MKKLLFRALALAIVVATVCPGAKASRYHYETVENDPMHSMIYTLPNGLKVYMSVNKDEPRIQTNIAVRVGSKNDPAETTGLAHYFEHMMFKGTKDFGTSDYAREKPMLDEIERLFEEYRVTTDSIERVKLYHRIDSISYEASKIAIPNEYDKLMSAIGANGTNAYTSYDMTCYVEDIPSNELERWAMIQANRFEFPVLRGFHTELETIYEEKNMSLTVDNRKLYETMLATLFPGHPYGQWSVLGHQQHLKNPSITNIKNYHKQWYVPNNMAILLSGDFDPDNAIDIITKYFGGLKPNDQLPKLSYKPEADITVPIERDVYGQEAEMLMLGWRFPGASHAATDTLNVIESLLNNGKSGLIDVDINMQQKALGVNAGLYALADYSMFIASGRPREGQTLEQLCELILAEFAKLRNGDFDENILSALVNWQKRNMQSAIESNNGRVEIFETCFINGIPLESVATESERLSKITKKSVVDFANKYLRDDNLVTVYKRQGKDPNELKIAKQPITPIVVNRDKSSEWLEKVVSMTTEPIEPVFVDFNTDLTFGTSHSGRVPVIYTQNKTNDLFQLTYLLDTGLDADKSLSMLSSYFPLLGTPTRTAEQIAAEMYSLACSYAIRIGGRQSYVILSGLSENMPRAMEIVDDLLQNAIADTTTWAGVVSRALTARENSKTNQPSNFLALQRYMLYGPEQLKAQTLSNDELRALDPSHLTETLKQFSNLEHKVIYYGPSTLDETVKLLEANHTVAPEFAPMPELAVYKQVEPNETVFYLAPYDSKQIYMYLYTNEGKDFNREAEPMRIMFNEYFGGGMNSIVFQEMREARSLAYSAWATLRRPGYLGAKESFTGQIATQNDKMKTAIEAFEVIIENMPHSEKAFDLAKTGIETRLRTERIIKDDIAWLYINNARLGVDTDMRKEHFKALPSMTLEDVVDFHDKNIKGRTYNYVILGDLNDIDIPALEKRGRVVKLTTDEIFAY